MSNNDSRSPALSSSFAGAPVAGMNSEMQLAQNAAGSGH